MKRITYTVDCYEYSELSDKAKERVNQWYLDDDFRPQEFENMVNQDIKNVFGDVEAHCQFSLNSCQGDGLNIYGTLNASAFFDGGPKNAPALPWPTGYTEKEKRTLIHYSDVCQGIKIPENREYSYCMSDYINISDEWENWLFDIPYKNINSALILKFQNDVQKLVRAYCKEWESIGYKYFYEADPEEVQETCEANNWFFDINGHFLPGV